jgi:hypothetical protein
MEQNVTYVIKALSVQEFLANHPMPLSTLSRLMGVSEDSVKSWSCGRRNPLPQVLTHLATLDERFKENPLLRAKFVKV